MTGSRDYHKQHSNDEGQGNGISKMKKRNDVILPGSSMQRLKKGMLIIRMKLMHVIRNFYFYLMARVSECDYSEIFLLDMVNLLRYW